MTDSVTPAMTVIIAFGPMKRITARYRPNSEKTTSAVASAVKK